MILFTDVKQRSRLAGHVFQSRQKIGASGALDAEKFAAKFRKSIDCAKKLGFPIFELRSLLALQSFPGLDRHDI